MACDLNTKQHEEECGIARGDRQCPGEFDFFFQY